MFEKRGDFDVDRSVVQRVEYGRVVYMHYRSLYFDTVNCVRDAANGLLHRKREGKNRKKNQINVFYGVPLVFSM